MMNFTLVDENDTFIWLLDTPLWNPYDIYNYIQSLFLIASLNLIIHMVSGGFWYTKTQKKN